MHPIRDDESRYIERVVMKYFILAITLLASYSQAEDCTYTKITAIQAQTSNVLINVSNGTTTQWKKLGDYSESYLNSFQSIAQQALAVGASIVLRFDGDHDCGASDFISIPSVIRINE